MIFLTGDIHHSSLRTGNQRHCEMPEVTVARRFLALLEAREVKATFFVSGLTFAEEWPELEPIVRHPLVEIGGHNWSCFTPELLHRASKKLLGSYNGPACAQRSDAERTIEIARRRAGVTIRAWRNHMYMHGPHTERVLRDCGIDLCSDGVQKGCLSPVRHATGVLNFPINVMPDHEHIYHAERTPEWVARWQRRYQWSDDFGSDSYPVEQWGDIVIEALRANERRGGISNVIVHPITMYLADRFATIARVLDFMAKHVTLHASEVVALARVAERSPEEAGAA
jgi:hypothetical protein